MSDHIPSGVVREILGHQSPWELGRLRCVNKEWRSIIDDPDFIQLQRRSFTSLFFGRCRQQTVLRIIPGTFGPGRGPLNLTYDYCSDSFPPSFGGDIIMGSYDGLLCLGDKLYKLLLFNPAFPEETRLVTLLSFMVAEPLLDGLFENGFTLEGYGFGYDKVARDYKAVLLVLEEWFIGKSYILTYRFGTKSFSCLPANKFLQISTRQCLGVPLCGALHWIARCCEINPPVIYSFDLGTDSISEFQLPDFDGDNECLYRPESVGVVNSCLALVATFRGRLDVWIMKEYGKEDSWCKLYSVLNRLFDGREFRHSGTLNGHILLSYRRGIVWVEPSSGSVQVVDIPVGDSCLIEPHLCLESTVKIFPQDESSG